MNEATRGEDATPQGRALQQEVWESVALMLQPIVPHIAHTLWQTLRGSDDVLAQRWPLVDEAALVRDQITLVVQVNGQLRGSIRSEERRVGKECVSTGRHGV